MYVEFGLAEAKQPYLDTSFHKYWSDVYCWGHRVCLLFQAFSAHHKAEQQPLPLSLVFGDCTCALLSLLASRDYVRECLHLTEVAYVQTGCMHHWIILRNCTGSLSPWVWFFTLVPWHDDGTSKLPCCFLPCVVTVPDLGSFLQQCMLCKLAAKIWLNYWQPR